MDQINTYADKPIREFGETIVNVLSTLAHGETGGLGELMAINLYLNNKYGTVFLHKIPVEPMTSSVDLKVARDHMHDVHDMILDKLYTFWDVWCSDKNVVKQYRIKYKDNEYAVILDEMNRNMVEANDLVRSLSVSGNIKDFIDFDPRKIALTDFVNGLVSATSMPDELIVDLQLKSFRASFEFNPRLVHEYHNDVFKKIYTCFYWSTITHLKLAVRILNEFDRQKWFDNRIRSLVYIIRPLTVFNINQMEFKPRLSSTASKNIMKLIAFLLNIHHKLRNSTSIKEIILPSKPEIQTFIHLLSTDMETTLNMKVPDNYYGHMSYERSFIVMQLNYQSFTRLVAATSGCKDDRKNLIKLKKSLLFLSEAIDFEKN